MMHISILTLFPDMFRGPFDSSIIKRAKDQGFITISYINIRDFATDKYKTVDGHPYGGGIGMILRVDVVDRALEFAKSKMPGVTPYTILLDAGGTPYKQKKAQELGNKEHLILICGHYEGIDERVRKLIDEELSIGDYVLTGGEIPAMVIVDSVVRLLPGVLKKADATIHESFTHNTLEYPQYTEPRQYKNMSVPDVLLSGNHAVIAAWRDAEATKRTKWVRRDL